jgi:hypothetical protein
MHQFQNVQFNLAIVCGMLGHRNATQHYTFYFHAKCSNIQFLSLSFYKQCRWMVIGNKQIVYWSAFNTCGIYFAQTFHFTERSVKMQYQWQLLIITLRNTCCLLPNINAFIHSLSKTMSVKWPVNYIWQGASTQNILLLCSHTHKIFSHRTHEMSLHPHTLTYFSFSVHRQQYVSIHNYHAKHLLCTRSDETTPKEKSHTHKNTKHHTLTPSCGKILKFSLNTGKKWS